MRQVFVFKVPIDISREDLGVLIKERLSLADFTLTQEQFDQLQAMDVEKEKVLDIINPHYDKLKKDDTRINREKLDELIDLGRFISHLPEHPKINIVECSERPDFIIEVDGEVIGVEHTRLIDDTVVADFQNMSRVIQRAQEILIEERPEITGLFNILMIPEKIKIDGRDFKTLMKTNPDVISKAISDYIINNHSDLGTVEYPDFIENIVWTKNSKCELVLSEEYIRKELTTDKIVALIEKKEAKIEEYKKEKGISKCYLLVVLNGASSMSSFEIGLDILPTGRKTPFDMIYIFDAFKGGYYWGKNT